VAKELLEQAYRGRGIATRISADTIQLRIAVARKPQDPKDREIIDLLSRLHLTRTRPDFSRRNSGMVLTER
jgi:hypothetical protein